MTFDGSGASICHKHRTELERSKSNARCDSSNAELHVHGHGYADAHAFVRSFAAFPEHPGSNVSLWIIICRVIDAFEAGSF